VYVHDMDFCAPGQATMNAINFWIFPLHVTFGLTIGKLLGLENFSLSSSMLSATVNARKSAQNCQNLPKSTQR
jgi:hypothetical protein